MYSILPAVVSALFLGFGLYVLLTDGLTRLSTPFALMCVCTFGWQGTWALLFQTTSAELAGVLVKAGYLFILFLPTTFYHFVTEVAGRRGERRLLLVSYGLCAVLAILLFTGDDLVAGFAMHDFGPYPKAGPLHPLHVLQTLFVACRSGWLLATAKREVGGKIRRRLLDRCLLGLYLYSLATVDYAVNYGAAFYPPGVVFIAAALGVLGVTIAQHGLTRPFLLAGAVAHETAAPLAAASMHEEQTGTVLPERLRGYHLAVQQRLSLEGRYPGQPERLTDRASALRHQVNHAGMVYEISLASATLGRVNPDIEA